MRSKKNLVIGFLLLLLGIGLSEQSLLLSVLAGVAGIVMMILYAAGKLKRNTSETSAVSSKTSKIQPAAKTQQANTQSVSFSLEAQQLYQQLADQYTRIVNNGCFGSLAQIEEKMDRCKCFLEQWMEALCNKDFVTLLQNKAKYDEYLKGFRLPQFGTWRTIQAEGGDDSIPDGLTKALVERIQGKQKMLQEFWEAQKWFEELIPSLQTYELTVDPDAEPLSKKLDYEYQNTNNVTSRTPLAKFNDFYAIDLETTGLSEVKNEIIQIAIIKFHHFQPVEILSSYVKPRKGLKLEAAAINRITEDMVADVPYIEQIMQSVDAFIGEKMPIVAHNLQFEYKFLAANGSENIAKKRPLYDTLELSKRIWRLESYSLENVCRNTFKFTPALHNAESDALTCGLLFRVNETRFRTVLSKNGFLLVFKALRNQGFSFLLSGLIPAKTLRIRN